jgi:tetratricopeptide (TPR) repeat protein
VNSVIIGLLGLLTATNQPSVVSNFVQQTTGASVPMVDAKDPVEQEYQKLLAEDDAAEAEIDKWIQDNEEFTRHGGGSPREVMSQRIRQRLEPVRTAYESFLVRHPNHSRARVAFASFLGDLNDEDGEQLQLEKALELDQRNPAIYNNLANLYTHTGPITNAIKLYEKAIALNPSEPLYYHNLGNVVYLFRPDAREYYHISEQEVFDKALLLYSNALRLDPTNFPLASDIAQTYYGIQPRRTDAALNAWTNTLRIAHDEIEREGVYIHMARLKIGAGRYAEARVHLNAVTNSMYDTLKGRLVRTLDEKDNEARVNKLLGQTNPPVSAPTTNSYAPVKVSSEH